MPPPLDTGTIDYSDGGGGGSWVPGVLGAAGGFLGGFADVVSSFTGKGSPDTIVYQQPPQNDNNNNGLLLIGGLAVVVVLMIVLLKK